MTSQVRRIAASGQMVWWLNAVLAQICSPDDAAGKILGTCHGLAEAPVAGPALVGALRGRGVDRAVLAVVEAGDPLGLPGPAPITKAAVGAGVAIVAGDGSITMIPADGEPPLDWLVLPSSQRIDPIAQLGSLGEAHSLMREGMLQISASMTGLEPDEVAMAELSRYRDWRPPDPPPGLPPRAAQLAESALRVWWLTGVAQELAQRRGANPPQQIRELRPLARRASAAAFSVPLLAPA
ncbi:MAG: hypothetical protein K0U60_04635 [Actinomycetia bacterium]|nr:hypothetical protein [Actinomycetes bacterium]MCH9801976.1 hypothetical protein [Actinomycetes bacterium]